MATYTTDFSEYSTGSAPSDWTDRWDTDWTTKVESSSTRVESSIGGQVLELDPGTTTENRLLSWDDIDSDANRDDVEVLIRFEPENTYNEYHVQAIVRGTGAAGAEYAYYSGVYGETLYIAKIVNGTVTNLDSVLLPYGSDLTGGGWIIFRANGTSLKAKAWDHGELEPSDWLLDITDSSVTGVGWVGLATRNDLSSRQTQMDYFEAVTNGGTTSVPTATTGDVQLNNEFLEVAYTNNDDPQINLNNEYVEVAYTNDDPVQINLNNIYIEVAYSNNPTVAENMPLVCINT